VPTRLSEKEKEALRLYAQLRGDKFDAKGEAPHGEAHKDKGFFGKLKDVLTGGDDE
jgi:hypothetical protein